MYIICIICFVVQSGSGCVSAETNVSYSDGNTWRSAPTFEKRQEQLKILQNKTVILILKRIYSPSQSFENSHFLQELLNFAEEAGLASTALALSVSLKC